MDSRNTPYRSEVSRWSPEDLADYFRRVSYISVQVFQLSVEKAIYVSCLTYCIVQYQNFRRVFGKPFLLAVPLNVVPNVLEQPCFQHIPKIISLYFPK
uniref:Uncharacterized protein n=1 Tax=Varanus komodoensis TaxID=61221 RepID=A0A8D2L9F7_VARKO